MERKKRLRLSLYIGLLVFVISCKSASHEHQSGDPKYLVNLHLHPGDKYYYTITNETRSQSELKNKKVESDRKSELGFVYEVLKDSAGSLTLKITYDKLHVNIKNGEMEKDISAKTSTDADPMEKFFGSLLGTSLTALLDVKGNILHVEGYKEVTDKILGSLGLKNGIIRNNIQQQMNKMVGEDFVRNSLQQAFGLFPDTAVYIDDSWNRRTHQAEEVRTDMNVTYTLNSVKNGIADITVRSVIDNGEKADSINVMGYEAIAELKGDQKGNFKVDTHTGMLVEGSSSSSAEGSLQIMGKEVPVKIKSEKKMSGKKIS